MNKKRVIFENEEEFDISFRFFMNVSFNDSYEIILNDAKKAGLIRKNPVEEAEALYKKERKFFSGGLECDENFSEFKKRNKTMTTFNELKKRTTPEIIKEMCKLAEGFNISYIIQFQPEKDFRIIYDDVTLPLDGNHLVETCCKFSLFPLLLHRAVEGWNNKTGKFICNLGNHIQYIFEKYYVMDYQPCHLTRCEMAIWDCLLNIL